jgi:2-phosphosulfolactate phosphatase
VPFVTVEETFSFAKNRQDTILGGERDSVLIPGFDLSNSPLEYAPEKVTGKTVALTTTNGTRAIRGAAEGAGQVLIGSLLNAGAAARAVADVGRDIVLVCAGARGKFSLEDTVAAGMVAIELKELTGGDGITFESDLAVAARRLAAIYREEPVKALYDSLHGQKLAAMGLHGDLAWCARLNHFDIVPVYREDRITVL